MYPLHRNSTAPDAFSEGLSRQKWTHKRTQTGDRLLLAVDTQTDTTAVTHHQGVMPRKTWRSVRSSSA
jgi:hypothetical protein